MRDNELSVKRVYRFFATALLGTAAQLFRHQRFWLQQAAVCTAESFLSAADAGPVWQEGGIVRIIAVAVKSFCNLFSDGPTAFVVWRGGQY